MASIVQKFRSFQKYRVTFGNWWLPASARYAGGAWGAVRLARLRNGQRLFFRPASDHVALGGVFVADVYAACRKQRAVRVVWDVGGNIGCFALWAGQCFPDAEIASFEPSPETFAILRRNREGNPGMNWQVYPYGLAAANEVCEGRTPGGMHGQTSRYAPSGQTVRLPLRHVAEVWNELGAPRIDVMKIDCEGGEYDIVEAMPDGMLDRVGFMIMETHPVSGKTVEAMVGRLAATGFQVTVSPKSDPLLVARRTTGRNDAHG